VAAAATGKLPALSPMPPAPDKAYLERTAAWDFDIFSVPYERLPRLAFSVLVTHPSIAASASTDRWIDQPKLWRFVCAIFEHYHERPFHNFRHATDVLLATTSIVQAISKDHPRPFEDRKAVAALLVSALVHDTDHPGVMNNYLAASDHHLARKLAKPVAVLENHHAEMAITLLQRPELDFLAPLDAAERQTFLDLMHANVLNTDVTTTMPAAKEFSERGRRPSITVTQFDRQCSDLQGSGPNAAQVHCMIIKAADISNPARRLAIYSRWIEGIMAEFFAQGDIERLEGRPLSLNCDRETVEVPKAQVGFITFLVLPLFRSLATYSQQMAPYVAQIDANLEHFQAAAAANGAAANGAAANGAAANGAAK